MTGSDDDTRQRIANARHLTQLRLMISNMFSKIVASSMIMLMLGSCSIGYRVDVLMNGNAVAFRFAKRGWFGGNEAVAVEQLRVTQLTENQPVVWRLDSVDYNGLAMRELLYGDAPKGMITKVQSQPIIAGVVYRADLLALGGGGSQQFVILPGLGSEQPITVLQH